MRRLRGHHLDLEGTLERRMTNLMAARWQMAISLGFHIIFAVIGIAAPLMMVIAEALWLRTGDGVYRFLAKSWARGAAILFAVGAVSGTVLSFELGLLWPHFMKFAGPIIGLGFGLEGSPSSPRRFSWGFIFMAGTGSPAGALAGGRDRCGQRGALGHSRRVGERLDEYAGRVSAPRQGSHQYRPDRRGC